MLQKRKKERNERSDQERKKETEEKRKRIDEIEMWKKERKKELNC